MANYVPFKINGNTLYLSGQGPRRTDGSFATGKVGRDVTVEQAYEHAKLVGLGLLGFVGALTLSAAVSASPSIPAPVEEFAKNAMKAG